MYAKRPWFLLIFHLLIFVEIKCNPAHQSEFQRVVRATLELPKATDAELEMLDILIHGDVPLSLACVSVQILFSLSLTGNVFGLLFT
jgi:hypothetical protein